jgi:HEAT repeat protein
MLWWTLQQLKSSNPESRIRAAQRLGAARPNRAVSSLIKALHDEIPKVRVAVIEALGSIGHPASAEPLTSVLLTVSKNSKSGASEECESLARALASVGSEAVRPLIQALASDDQESRRWAARALGMIKDRQAVEPLVQRLEDSRSEVRKAAALALGEIGDLRALKPLIKALSGRDLETRRTAAEALGFMGSGEAVDALAKAVPDQSEPVQLAVIGALARIGGLPAAASLRSAMGGPRKTVSDAAEAALKSMRFSPANAEERAEFAVIRGDFAAAACEGTAAVPALVRSLASKDAQIRVKAVEVLAELRSPDSVVPLLHALKDHNSAVQESAAQALTSIGNAALPGLEASLSFYDASVVRLAAAVLGKIGEPSSVPALLDLIAANSRISGEYPELFDAVHAATESLGGILSACTAKIARQDLERISELPEDIQLLGQSPKMLDCTKLRSLAADELRQR